MKQFTLKMLFVFFVFVAVVAVIRYVNGASEITNVQTIFRSMTNSFNETVMPNIQNVKEYTNTFVDWSGSYNAISQPSGDGIQIFEWVKYIAQLIGTTFVNLYHTIVSVAKIVVGVVGIFVSMIGAIIDFVTSLFGFA